MTENKTSKVRDEFLKFLKDNPGETMKVFLDKDQSLALLRQHKKMEEALGQIQQTEPCALSASIADEALSFDPLSEQ